MKCTQDSCPIKNVIGRVELCTAHNCPNRTRPSDAEVLYVVQFHRKDGKQMEEYEYWKLENAQSHFDLFLKDDSGLYHHIDLRERRDGRPDVLLQRIQF